MTAVSETPLEREGGWRIAVVYFGLVSISFAQPVFDMILLFRREFQFSLGDVFQIVFVFQYLTAAALVVLRRMLRLHALRLTLDFFTAAAAALIMARQFQIAYMPSPALQTGEKIALAAVIAVLAGAVIFAARRFLMKAAFYAGIVSPVFGVLFVLSVVNHDLPLRQEKPAASAAPDKPGVVLAVIDAFSADVLRGPGGGVDAEKFPNTAGLAARGIWWSNAIFNQRGTRYSFPSFLTSKFPVENSIEKWEDLPEQNLLNFFENAGYRIHAYSDYFGCAGTHIRCTSYLDAERPGFMFSVFRKWFDIFRPHFIGHSFFPLAYADLLRTQSRHLIETVRTAEPGDFHLLHLLTTHVPYVMKADGSYNTKSNTEFIPDRDSGVIISHYIGQARYADSVIGKALDAAEKRPDDKPLIFMLVSDHGTCLTEKCAKGVRPETSLELHQSVTHIPAALLSPLHSPRVDEDDFQLIDVMPTLCEAAGVKKCGENIDGVSRLRNPPPQRPRRLAPFEGQKTVLDIPLPAAAVKIER